MSVRQRQNMALILATIQIESNFNHYAVKFLNTLSLMQIKQNTAQVETFYANRKRNNNHIAIICLILTIILM
ncbi:MAG: transglycosylase SLT domain-containing protein [Arsenophonus sp. NC-XBC3-MAG3]